MYVTAIKKQNVAFISEGPKAAAVFGGKKAIATINSLNLVLGTITIQAEGVHVGTMYDLPPSGFTWTDYDHLATSVNLQPSVGGEIVDSGSGPGTLIQRQINTDPAFCTAFRV